MEDTAEKSVTDSLLSLARGGYFHVLGQLLSRLSGFFLNWLLATTLGANIFGIYVYGNLFVSVAGMFADLGAKRALLRFLPEFSHDERKSQYVTIAFLVAISSSTTIATLLFLTAPYINRYTLDNGTLTLVLRILAISIPFITSSAVASHVFRAEKQVGYQVLIDDIVLRYSRLFLVGGAILLGATLVDVVFAVLVAAIFTAIVAFFLMYYSTPFGLERPEQSSAKRFIDYSLPVSMSNIEVLMYSTVDVFMLGFFLTSTEVGVYKIAVLISSFLTFPLLATNKLFPSVASKLYTDGKNRELQAVFSTVTRWTVSVSVFMSFGALIYRRELLMLFGAEYVRGVSVLTVFVIAYFLNTAVGPSNWMLLMADRQYLVMLNHWVFGSLNVILNFILINEIGLIGAAIASAGSIAALNVTRLVELQILEGFQPYTAQYLKPIVAAVVGGLAMFVIKGSVQSILVLFVGGAVGAIVFCTTLVVFGIEKQDRKVFQEMLSNRD